MKMSRIYSMHRVVYLSAGGLMLASFLPHAAPSLWTRRYDRLFAHAHMAMAWAV